MRTARVLIAAALASMFGSECFAQALGDLLNSVDRRDWDKVIASATLILTYPDTTTTLRGLAAHYRAMAYVRRYRYEEALADVNFEFATSPLEDSAAHLVRGTAYAGLGRYDEAIADYDQAIALILRPQRALCTFYARSLAYARKGEQEKAEADVQQAEALVPDRALQLYCLGNSKLEIGDSSGRSDIDAARALTPDIVELAVRSLGKTGFDP
jgi:tetratricopeptide (TPR) repeat protein